MPFSEEADTTFAPTIRHLREKYELCSKITSFVRKIGHVPFSEESDTTLAPKIRHFREKYELCAKIGHVPFSEESVPSFAGAPNTTFSRQVQALFETMTCGILRGISYDIRAKSTSFVRKI